MNPVKVSTIKKIAKSKRLSFDYDEANDLYHVKDKKGMLLMEYAPITLMLITDPSVWRREFNIMRDTH